MRGLLRAVRTATPGRSSVGRRASSNAAEGDATETWRVSEEERRGARGSAPSRGTSALQEHQTRSGALLGFPTEGTFGVRAVRPESKVCPSSVYSHGENRARGTA